MAKNKIYYVDELNAKADFVNMKVKIIRKVKQSWLGIHMILIDEKGNKIQATVKKELITNFDEQLKEDAVVLIKKFGCGVFQDSNRVVKGDLKMNFYRCTEVCREVSFTGHPYGGFNFLPFNEVTKAKAGNKKGDLNVDVTKAKPDNKDILNVDVIGGVCWCGNLDIFRSPRGKETKRFNFEMKDLEGKVLKCTLWNDYAVQFNNFVKNNTSPEHIITIIQRGIIREWNNNLTIQSDVWATRVFINEEIQEAQDFRRSLILKEGNAAASTSVLSSQVAYPIREEFLEKHVRKHVDEIRETEQKMECIVLAEIRMLEEEHGWFYVGCQKCTTKALTKQQYLEKVAPEYVTEEVINAPTDSLWCLNEKKQATQLEPRFRVTFRVQDATGSASFCMLNRDVQNILRLTAADIRERQLKSGDTQAYPHELEKLLNKVFAFHIVVSIYNLERDYNIYSVLKVCDDPDILAELVKKDNDNEVTQEPKSAEVSSLKLAESSQGGCSSKDAFSVTGDSVATELEKDTDTSPLQKTSSVTPGAESTSRASKRVRKIFIQPDV